MDVAELERMSVAALDKRLRQMIQDNNFRVSEIVDTILTKSVLLKTSDIHIEPTRRGVRIRCRVDGCFTELATLPLTLHDQLVSRIKVLADLISHQRGIV